MGLENVPRCQHLKVNGTQCGSPALRYRRFCFFHDRFRREQARISAAAAPNSFDLPLLEDANSVQIALMKVIQMLGSGQINHKTAGLMLYALQTASINLHKVNFEPRFAHDVVIDRDTVHLTCIKGQQWFEEDFDEEEEGSEEDQEENNQPTRNASAEKKEDSRTKTTTAKSQAKTVSSATLPIPKKPPVASAVPPQPATVKIEQNSSA